MNLDVIVELAIALALGVIIGLERGWRNRADDEGYGDSGLRNFSICGLLGGIAALLAQSWGFSILVGIFLGLAGLVATSYVLTAKKSGDYGSTTELALMITFCLGALALSGFTQEAIAVAVVVAWILGAKPELTKTLNWLQRQELIATLQLLLIAVVVLPLLPNQAMGPWNALNPRAIGWLVLLIAGISYIGYFAIRILGSQVGLMLTGFFGGIASSTALTVSFSRMAKQQPSETISLAAGIVLANGIMAPRLLLVIAVVSQTLAYKLAAPLLILGLIPVIAAVAIARWKTQPQDRPAAEVSVNNPVELGSALQYTALLVILSLLVRWAQEEFGEQGIYLLSALSGFADVDAVSLSLANAVQDDLPEKVAMYGIWLAVTANTLVKVGFTRTIGNLKLAYWCGSIMLSGLIAGFLVLLAV
ncbi:MgtC/SapB family protein [Picosynechococcus sp. PCC 7117]|uniref:MgtC/SapB family protein n=1 Tax=Picosynechococcus sp. PCC 7117 TaxID=195498 RepID=UPI000810D4FD|nr:MgtC/SapB family protein [Picosynechococcus sp. PCC 7117]ANV87585.1 MgtC/SapB transporter [Picosynechococcus sp. PCC 7117]